MSSVDTDRDLLPRYVNGADGWLGLRADGVEVGAAGELRLQSIPDLGTPYGPALAATTEAPGGWALDDTGTGGLSDPDSGRVLVLTTCPPQYDDTTDLLGRRATDTELMPGRFVTPRGLVLGPRGRLYVADAGADAVLAIELATGTITGWWSDVVEPWCLATDGAAIYVLDRGGASGAGRVRRFDADGVADPSFAKGLFSDPVRFAVGGSRLLVVDRGVAADTIVPVVLGGPDDGTVDGNSQAAWAHPARVERDPRSGTQISSVVTRIAGVAAADECVYLVDASRGDLLTFTADGGNVGSTAPVHPLADLQVSGPVLWSAPAAAGTLLRHDLTGSRLRAGAFVCGPLATGTVDGRRELRARVEWVVGAHLQLWTAVTPGNVAPKPSSLPGPDPAIAPAPGAAPWAALPADVDVALISGAPGPQLWIGGRLSGDGSSTPSVHQLSVAGARGWIDHLPAIYRRDDAQSNFLDRYLRLVQSVQEETSAERVALVRRFDPWTASDPARGGALDVLADWLDLRLDERWDETTRRGIVAGAFAAQGLRGTPRGLAAAIEARFPSGKGEPAITLSEPAQGATIWVLEAASAGNTCGCHGSPSGLGFDTMLVAGPADGAVVGASAVVGQSSLTAGVDVGTPLFADLAHRFHVSASEYVLARNGGEPALRALIDAERPAHTTYTLCVFGPNARVGVQTRVGIDAIVSGPSAPLDLGGPPRLDLVSLGAPAGPNTVDEPSAAQLGATRLGQGRLS